MWRADATAALAAGASTSDTAIVEGRFDSSLARPSDVPAGSSLDTLCDWLDLPRIAVVDVRELAALRLGPSRRARIDALLLDRVADASRAAYWQTTLEALWKTPVLGWLDEASPLADPVRFAARRRPIRRASCARHWASRLLPTLAARPAASTGSARAALHRSSRDRGCLSAGQRRFRIAVAYDEAYCGYYPETLDLLEAAGAELCDFSPLKSESIPDGADVVYFGCGHPEREPEQLAKNHCLKQSLRCFAAGGGRIYAEGSGLAYLCREIAFPCGRTMPMTGLLPAIGPLAAQRPRAEPTESRVRRQLLARTGARRPSRLSPRRLADRAPRAR